MVRAHVKQTPEEKKEKSKKKSHSKKKASDLGTWPCTINECGKVFAREADLKRHQRTTKGHSEPAYACPQCDATFTRTDALRRHQKSRHNGMVVESSSPDAKSSGASKGEDSDESLSSSSSRGTTPAKEEPHEPQAKQSPPKPEQTRASYYRQHAMQPTYGSPLPPPPAIFMEGQYPHAIAIPTSAARLSWPGWSGPPPWATDGPTTSASPPPPPQAMYHVPPPYYHAPPYYRHYGPVISGVGPHGYPPPQFHPDYMPRYNQAMYPGGAPPPNSVSHSRTPSASSLQPGPSSPISESGSVSEDDMDSDAERSERDEAEEATPAPQDHSRRSSPRIRLSPHQVPPDIHSDTLESGAAQNVGTLPSPVANDPKEANGSAEAAAQRRAVDVPRKPETAHVLSAMDREDDLRVSAVRAASEALAILSRDRTSSDLPATKDPAEFLSQASAPQHSLVTAL